MKKQFLAEMLMAFAVIGGAVPYAVAAPPQPMNAPAGCVAVHPAGWL